VVLPLAVPDLPVILWCRARLTRMAEFREIAKMAAKVVLDSGEATGKPMPRRPQLRGRVGRMLDLLARRAGGRPGMDASDAGAMLARVFEDRGPGEAAGVSVRVSLGAGFETRLVHGGAWAVNALERCRGQARSGDGAPQRLRSTWSWRSDFRVQLERRDDRLSIAVSALPCVNLPPPSIIC
jgi:hypothetical protein